MKPGKTGLCRIIDATKYSCKGFSFAWKHEAAFRQELILSLILIPLGLWLGDGATEKALLIGVCFITLMVEILNTSIEAVVDRVGNEYHELAGSAKDLGSAAVFISLVMTATVWSLILYEKFFLHAIN
ncbi:MAG: diacylglycerol kinase [Gammaproteobacteria bacterium]|nr:diacylglycerol kinase [Gammaproteobacteria bacterium]